MTKIGTEMASQSLRLSRQQAIVDADQAYIQAVEAHEMQTVAKSYQQLLQSCSGMWRVP